MKHFYWELFSVFGMVDLTYMSGTSPTPRKQYSQFILSGGLIIIFNQWCLINIPINRFSQTCIICKCLSKNSFKLTLIMMSLRELLDCPFPDVSQNTLQTFFPQVSSCRRVLYFFNIFRICLDLDSALVFVHVFMVIISPDRIIQVTGTISICNVIFIISLLVIIVFRINNPLVVVTR